MHDIVIALIAALTSTGVCGLVQYFVSRHDNNQQEGSVEREALKCLMMYVIQAEADRIIAKEQITLSQKQMLHRWHNLYHKGLGGNGDLDVTMEIIDELPIVNK